MYLACTKTTKGGIVSFSGLALLPLEKGSGILAKMLDQSEARDPERMDFPISKILSSDPCSRNTVIITSRENWKISFWELEKIAGCLWEKKTYLFFFCRLIKSESSRGKKVRYFPKDFSVPESQTEQEIVVFSRCLAGIEGDGSKGKRWAITQNIKLPQKLYLSMLTI